MTSRHCLDFTVVVVWLVMGTRSFCAPCSASEELPAEFFPQSAPEASSLTVTMSIPTAGTSSDSSGLSGNAVLHVGQTQSPYDFAQLADVELVLVDGMDFTLLGGLVTAQAAPGATRLVMIQTGDPGDVVNGQFDQLENIIGFEGEIFLSTEEGPFDLSTVAPVLTDLRGIQLLRRDNQLVAQVPLDVEFSASVASPVGQIPLTIFVQGTLEAIATLSLLGDFDGNGVLDALDIDALHLAIRTSSTDAQFDLNDDGTLDERDSETLVQDLIGTHYGDTNLDGLFESDDLIDVLGAGEYEDEVLMNSTWIEGDWSGDAEFNSNDLILALASGCYEGCIQAANSHVVPEPSAWMLAVLGFTVLIGHRLR